jgi:RNA recognition motif. (a.k.a. RRM, RBD, or RNP domain)
MYGLPLGAGRPRGSSGCHMGHISTRLYLSIRAKTAPLCRPVFDLVFLLPLIPLCRNVAEKHKTEPKLVKLVSEGIELEDGLTLGDLFVANLSTVKVVISSPPAAPAAPAAEAKAAEAPAASPAGGEAASAAPGASAAGSDESGSVVSDDEALRTIIVTNIPSSDPVTTERALLNAFQKFGLVQSMMIQDEQIDHATSSQRAVIVFQNQNAAVQALSVDNTFIMPSPTFKEVRVTLAGNLALRDAAAAGAGAGGAAGGEKRFFNPSGSNAVSRLLASGYLAGENGVASVKRFTNEKAPAIGNAGTKIKVTASNVGDSIAAFNQKYKITTTLEDVFHQSMASLADIDKELKVSEKIKSTASYALAQASMWTRKAMQSNPTFASTVTSASTFMKEAGQALSGTLEGAKQEVGAKRASLVGNPAAGGGQTVGVGLPLPPAEGATEGGAATAAGAEGGDAVTKPALASPAVASSGTSVPTTPAPSAGGSSATGAAAGGAASSDPDVAKKNPPPGII